MYTKTKKVLTNSRVKRSHELQEFQLESIERKIFPEAFSGYPVNGQFYKAAV